jgi:hypothetical protein
MREAVGSQSMVTGDEKTTVPDDVTPDAVMVLGPTAVDGIASENVNGADSTT